MGLGLDVLDGDLPALPGVSVEGLVASFPTPDPGQLLAEAHRIVDTAVEPHAPQGVVDMGGVAREKDSALAIRLSHPLVHFV